MASRWNDAADIEVLIAGAGPIGLMQAASLLRLGVSCRIVDQSPRPVQTSNAVTVHARTLEQLEPFGLASSMVTRGAWIRSVEFSGHGRILAQFPFSSLKSRYQGVLSLPQNITEQLLGRYLVEHGLAVERPVRLISFEQDANGINSVLEHNDGSHEAVRSRYLVGCDGGSSTVRKLLNLEPQDFSERKSYLLADLKIHWTLPSTQLSVFLHREGIVLAIPLPEGRHRIIADVLTEKPDSGTSIEQLRALFARRVSMAATLSDVSWLTYYQTHQGWSSEFSKGRVFIAGDAAHLHHPGAALGLNIGIQDALNLAWKLALVIQGQAKNSLLDSYAAERVPIASSMLELCDQLLKAMALSGKPVHRMSNLVLALLSGSESFHQSVRTEFSELGLHYRSSPIVQNEGTFPSHAPQPGDQAPTPALSNEQSLGAILHPAAHNLLLFTGESPAAKDVSWLSSVRRDMQSAYPGLIYGHLISRGAMPPELQAVKDTEGKTHAEYGANSPCLYLIRPDCYVGYRARTPDSLALHRFLKETYGFTSAQRAASH
jgi:2-polyprenyl-6-methoxyphenol hydroxylase-like FAD-dependent oxidoreductase